MRYGLAILIVAFLAVVTVAVVVGGNDSDSGSSAPKVTKAVDYENDDDAALAWTQQGKLVGEDQRQAIRITITRNKRQVEVLSGYPERVERSTEFANSPEGFAAFTRALDNAGFGRERTVTQSDERGMCPGGNRFIYEVKDAGQQIMRTWSDNCNRSNGTFGGGSTAGQIGGLFKNQITDYSDFISGVQL